MSEWPRGGGRRARLLLAVAMIASVLPGAGVSAAYAADASYEHIWQARTLFAGETGSTRSEVLESLAEVRFKDGLYTGSIVYRDLLGIADATGSITSQEARIELALLGDPLEAGAAAGGTFTGTATMVVRSAPSLGAAVSEDILGEQGEEVVFNVRGHWGALAENGTLVGEVLYERARVVSGEGVAHEPAWFNRASLANPDGLGDPQLVRVTVTGDPAPVTGGQDDDGDGSGGDRTMDGDGASGQTPDSVFGYIAQGLRGVPAGTPPAVSDAEDTAARRLLDARPAGARALPEDALAVDVHLAGAYLDAKNRAAGLLGEDGPLSEEAASLELVAQTMRAAATRAPAPDAGTPSAEHHADRVRTALSAATGEIGNADALLAALDALGPRPDREQVALVRTWASVAEAVAASRPLGSVLADGAALSARVATAPVPAEGPLAMAVLAAADSYLAPSEALVVRDFAREESVDFEPVRGVADSSLPGRVLSIHGSTTGPPALAWVSSAGQQRVAPVVWTAYRRGDTAIFWLAGDDANVALTDASIRGWAFSRSRAALVDSTRCGRVIEHFRAE